MTSVDKQLKILLVDDTPQNIKLVEKYLQSQGHEMVVCSNGREAVEMFGMIQPDLILMDVMMPEMDGYEATRMIRKLSPERWIPIIFLSALSDNENLLKGLEAGGDDYLAKPIDLRILGAKVRAMQRIAAMQDQIARDSEELAAYHQHTEHEKALARDVLERMTRSYGLNDERADVWCLPAEKLSGDVIAVQRCADDRLYIMVADATGHGLVAAFSQLPVSQLFYELASQGISLSAMAERINHSLYELLPPDRFVATTLAIVDENSNTIEIWNGGNPPAVLFDEQSRLIKTFISRHPPLGIFGDENFDDSTETISIDESSYLLLCSDGLFEVIGDNFQTDPEVILENISRENPAESAFQVMQKVLRDKLGEQSGPDDISMVGIDLRRQE